MVSKYSVVRSSLIDNNTTPLQVGNGNFAFSVDNTGMQVSFQPENLDLVTVHLLTRLGSRLDVFALQYYVKLGLA